MISKAIILGRIGSKKHKSLDNGGEMTTLSIATNRKYITKAGDRKENTSWHNCNCFGKIAEIAEKYAEVGDLIYIEGQINNNKIDGSDPAKWAYSITVGELKLLPNGRKNENERPKKEEPKQEDDGFDSIPF